MSEHDQNGPAPGGDDSQQTDTGAPATAPQDATGQAPSEERTMGMLCHLLALLGFIGIPFGNFIGPLIIWLMKKDQSEFVNDQGKESLNFQITVTIGLLLSIPLYFICIGPFVTAAIAIAAIVFVIIAAVSANGGNRYRYPWTLRLIK